MGQIQTFSEVMNMLRRRLSLIILVTLIGCVISLYYALNQPKYYEATAVIQIEAPQIVETPTAPAATGEVARRLQLIQQRLMARDNLIDVIDKHNLFAEAPNMPITEKVFQLRIATRIDQIREGVESFQPGARPSGLIVTVRWGDPEKAAIIANEFVQTVMDENRARLSESARETLAFFSEEEIRVSSEIDVLEATIADFKRANADALPENLTSLRSQLANLQETILEIDRQIIALDSGSSRQRAGVIEGQVSLLEDQKMLVQSRIDTLNAALASAPAVAQQYNGLTRELRQLQDQFSAITRRRADAELGEALQSQQQTERFEILETALVPETPVSPSRKKVAMLGGFVSVLAGLVAAFALEVFNPAIRSAEQLERALDISPVVSIPRIATSGEKRRKWMLIAGVVVLALTSLPVLFRTMGDRFGSLKILSGN